MDRALNSIETCIRIVLTTPEESIIKQSFTLGFFASNNEAEYEIILARLRMVITLRVTRLEVRCNFSLVVNQVRGEYVARNARMVEYVQLVFELKSKIPQCDVK